MRLVEQEQAHRFELERKAVEAEIKDAQTGKIIGAVMTLVCAGGAIYIAHIGGPWQIGVAIVGVPVMALISRLVRGK